MMPLTAQEQAVKDFLLEERLPFEAHYVFELKAAPIKRISVDFLVFLAGGVVLECTSCSRKRGSALSELRRRSAYMDLRFRLLKVTLPKLVCGAFIEAPNETKVKIAALRTIFGSADFVAASVEELRESTGKLRAPSRR